VCSSIFPLLAGVQLLLKSWFQSFASKLLRVALVSLGSWLDVKDRSWFIHSTPHRLAPSVALAEDHCPLFISLTPVRWMAALCFVWIVEQPLIEHLDHVLDLVWFSSFLNHLSHFSLRIPLLLSFVFYSVLSLCISQSFYKYYLKTYLTYHLQHPTWATADVIPCSFSPRPVRFFSIHSR